MFGVGDIVRIFAPVAGRNKFHLCISVGTEEVASKFLFLNSNPSYSGCYSVPCERVPCIEPSDTGFTAFSFTMVPRYSDAQLTTYKAVKIGDLDATLASELLIFARDNAKALTKGEMAIVELALEQIAGKAGAASA